MKLKKKSIKKIKSTIPCACSKTQQEVKRILKNNMNTMEEGQILFAKSFLTKLIQEQEENLLDVAKETGEEEITKTPEDFTPEKNKKDFESSLDPTTPKNEYDVEGVSPEIKMQNIGVVQDFTDKLDEFASFLNNPENTSSLHKVLADNDRPGNLLRGVTRKTSDAITRVAGEIEKIKEVLNSFIITAPKKIRDTESINMS
jgi:hypothetical protein